MTSDLATISITTVRANLGYGAFASAIIRILHVPLSIAIKIFLTILQGPERMRALVLPVDAVSKSLLIGIFVSTSSVEIVVHIAVTLGVVAENRICGVPPTVISVPNRKNEPTSLRVGMNTLLCAREIATQSIGIASVASPGERQRYHCSLSLSGICTVPPTDSWPTWPRDETVGNTILSGKYPSALKIA